MSLPERRASARRRFEVLGRLRAPERPSLLQSVKVAVATITAWIVAGALVPGQMPVFAAIAALLVVQPSVNQSLGKAIERCLGVLAGVILATIAGAIFGPWQGAILVVVVLGIFLAWALRLAPGSSNQIPISAMLVLSIGASSEFYALDRILETLIGAAIALLVNVAIVPPVHVAPVREDVQALAHEAAASLDRLAAAVTEPRTTAQLEGLMIEARLLRPMRKKALDSLAAGLDSLSLNPRRSRHRAELDEAAALLERLGTVVNRVTGMTRAVRDHYDDSLHLEPRTEDIAIEARRAAHDVRLLAPRPSDASAGTTPAEPALTAPLRIAAPEARHWVLIGSLVEDLRRIHEEIAGTE